MATFGWRVSMLIFGLVVFLCTSLSYYRHTSLHQRQQQQQPSQFQDLSKTPRHLYDKLTPETRQLYDKLTPEARHLYDKLTPEVHTQEHQQLPVIFIITPTFTRLEQKAELTRMSHTLKLVTNAHWIVVEDSKVKTRLVANLLKSSGLRYTHLNASTFQKAQRRKSKPGQLKHRGVEQRNAGLKWLRSNPYPLSQGGVLYFADDDNTYSLKLFDEMRFTKKVSVWPVGLLGGQRFESPIVQDQKVVGWYAWAPNRTFAMDMCSFGVNLRLVFDHPDALFNHPSKEGQLETSFVSKLGVTLDDLEPKAGLCSEILVWHTRTEKTVLEKLEDRIFINDGIENKEKLIEKYTSDLIFEFEV